MHMWLPLDWIIVLFYTKEDNPTEHIPFYRIVSFCTKETFYRTKTFYRIVSFQTKEDIL